MIKYFRNSRTLSGKLHEELVMMDVGQGKYFSLNRVATRIWEHLEVPQSLDELCELLVEEYDIESEQCRKETGELLKLMVKLGLLTEQWE